MKATDACWACWISVDPSTTADGIAIWCGSELRYTAVIRQYKMVDGMTRGEGRLGLRVCVVRDGPGVVRVGKPSSSRSALWADLLLLAEPVMMVYEGATGGGKGYHTALTLEEHRGDVRRWCAMAGVQDEVRVGVQEWRTILGVKTKRCGDWKAAARERVRLSVLAGELPAWVLHCGPDEIDAVCVGMAHAAKQSEG